MSPPPPEVLRWVEDRFGPARVVAPLGGGCINPAVRVQFPSRVAFLKYNEHPPPAFFSIEAPGLEALRAVASSLRMPEVLGVCGPTAPEDVPGPGALLLEWLVPQLRRAVYQLFYLLVHVNLFGAGYLLRTESTLRRALSAR
ncbi:hypothetical protein BH23GEM3_BH23GEM3_09600 [soil metagenome]|nr:fructosamine kinase family protein [Gemmatimonadota bacterium]